MLKRLVRLIVGLLLVTTSPLCMVIFLSIWVITGKDQFTRILKYSVEGTSLRKTAS